VTLATGALWKKMKKKKKKKCRKKLPSKVSIIPVSCSEDMCFRSQAIGFFP
jgi:hypothetical protein